MQRIEQGIQRAIADLLRLVLDPDEVVFTAIGHGGGGRTRGAILKSMGLLPGVGDIEVMWAKTVNFSNGEAAYHEPSILWLEVKSPKGRQSPDQREFQRRVVALGHRYHLVHSPEEAYEALRKAGCPLRAIRFSRFGSSGYRIERMTLT